jgi:hypothetical protein
MSRHLKMLDAALWAITIVCGLGFFFSQDWLYRKRPHAPMLETGQTWEVHYHGASFFLSPAEFMFFEVALPGVAIIALLLGATLRRSRPQ